MCCEGSGKHYTWVLAFIGRLVILTIGFDWVDLKLMGFYGLDVKDL